MVFKFNSLKNHPLVKNSFWVLFNIFFQGFFFIFLSIFLTRILSSEIYGIYQFVLSIFLSLSFISLSGFNTSLFTSVSKGFDGFYSYSVKKSFKWSFLAIPIFILISSYYYFFQNNPIISYSFLIMALFFPLFFPFSRWQSFYQGKERFDLIAKNSILLSLSYLFFVFLSTKLFGNSLFVVLLSYLLSYSVFHLIFYFRSLRYVKNSIVESDSEKFGFFLTKLNVLSLIVSKLDFIIIGFFSGFQNLAVYSIAMLFISKLKDLSKVSLSVLSPSISRSGFSNKKHYFFIFLASVLFSGILFLIFPFIITIFYSSEYAGASYLIRIFLVFFPFGIINLLLQNHILFYLKNKKILLLNNTVLPVINAILLIVGLYFFKLTGLVIVYGLMSIVRLLFALILLKFNFKKVFIF